jgi:hypothetical protein
MRVIYIDGYFLKDIHRCVFTGVSLPILERKNIKTDLRSISDDALHFDKLDEENVKTYYDYCNLFIKNNNMSATAMRVPSCRRSYYCKQIYKIIEAEYLKYDKEKTRVYIPFQYDKTFLKSLNAMVKSKGLDIQVEEIKYEESKISQLANLISGCICHHDIEELYLENLGKKGKPQLIAYLYSCKNPRRKLDIIDFHRKEK